MNVLTIVVLTVTLTLSKENNSSNDSTEDQHLFELATVPERMNISMSKSALIYVKGMYDLVRAKEHGEEITRNKRHSDYGSIEEQLEQSDKVITFDGHLIKNKEVSDESGAQLCFDMTKLSAAEKVVGSELRIFQNGVFNFSKETFLVSVYRLPKLEYISSVNTSGIFEGWLSLNLTSHVQSWLNSTKTKRCLYLSVKSTDAKELEIQPESIGLLNSNKTDETEPFVVIFLKKTQFPLLPRHQKLSIEETHPKNKTSEGPCRRRPLYVNFTSIGWSDWIIAPEGYDAYYCSGTCENVFTKKIDATNHAVVQELVHRIQPARTPNPCCVPEKLTPISMLYMSEGNIILKNAEDMVVLSCGCH